MKRFIYVFLVLFGVAAMAVAQQPRNDGRKQPTRETTNLSGTLEIEQGRIVLKSGEKSYFIHGLRPLIGFVDSLKEGARVSLEGFVIHNNREGAPQFYRATKITIGSKSYDLPANDKNNRMKLNYARPIPYGFQGPVFRGMPMMPRNNLMYGHPDRRMLHRDMPRREMQKREMPGQDKPNRERPGRERPNRELPKQETPNQETPNKAPNRETPRR